MKTETQKEKWKRYMRNYRAKYPDRVKKARRISYKNRKLKAITKVGEAKCVRCGCDQIDFLEFNHIGGGGTKEWRANHSMSTMDMVLSRNRKIDDLEILCRVCNALDYLERKNTEAKRFAITWH